MDHRGDQHPQNQARTALLETIDRRPRAKKLTSLLQGGTAAEPRPGGSPEHVGLQHLRYRIRRERETRISGVLEHRLHAGGLVFVVELSSSFVRDVGAEPAQPSYPILGFLGPCARNLHSLTGDLSDLHRRDVRGLCSQRVETARASSASPFRPASSREARAWLMSPRSM